MTRYRYIIRVNPPVLWEPGPATQYPAPCRTVRKMEAKVGIEPTPLAYRASVLALTLLGQKVG